MGESVFGPDKGGAWAVLITVLVFFTLLAIISREFIPIPAFLHSVLVPKSNGKGSSEDFFLSARSSAGTTTIALSFFASGMGAWILYGTTEMGANPELSWLGVIGYSSSSAFPAIIISMIGPKVRKLCGEKAFGTTDFARQRYGRVMQLSVACISVFYMFIYIVAELTSISNIYGMIVGENINIEDSKPYTTGIVLSIAIITFIYTAIAGLPASIVTDRFQGVMMITLVIILMIAVTTQSENKVTNAEFQRASNFTIDGFMAWITLVIAILSAEMFNQGNWQRVWAAKDVPSMRKGFAIGSVMVFLLMFFFGIMGMISYANDPDAFDSFQKFYYLSFFYLLESSPTGVNYLVLILVTCLAASSIDTLQNAILSVFSRDILAIPKCNTKIGCASIGAYTTRFLLLVINVPAVFMATKRVDVITLFLVADLVCATAVLPLFLGLISEKKLGGVFTPITEFGAFLGIMTAMSAVLINGAILGVTKATNMFGERLGVDGPFAYFWLTNGDICALCGSKTMITFIITPLAGGLGAIMFSHLDILVRGEESARKPIFGKVIMSLEAMVGMTDEDKTEVEEDKFKENV